MKRLGRGGGGGAWKEDYYIGDIHFRFIRRVLSCMPWIFPHTSVLTLNVHSLPLCVRGTSTLLQTIPVLRVDAGQLPQSEVMVYNCEHPGIVPLQAKVSSSSGSRVIVERVIDSGGGTGAIANYYDVCISNKKNLHNSNKKYFKEMRLVAPHACMHTCRSRGDHTETFPALQFCR